MITPGQSIKLTGGMKESIHIDIRSRLNGLQRIDANEWRSIVLESRDIELKYSQHKR